MKTYHGSCHCGALRFEADIDLGQGTLKCNCSICRKRRFWPAIVQPGAFRLLAGTPAVYQFGARNDHHYYCKACGVHTFGTGNSPRWGAFYAVSLSCLDDASDEELAAAPVTFIDGRNDCWDVVPDVVGYL
jgi:hypothetical protein